MIKDLLAAYEEYKKQRKHSSEIQAMWIAHGGDVLEEFMT